MPPLPILYEDNHLLVINKPAGLPTMGVSEDLPSAWRLACGYIKQKYEKPGKVYLGVVSRLDTVTSGVLVFARTSKSADRLSSQIRQHLMQKTYWAVPETPLPQASGEMRDWVFKDDAAHRMRVTHAKHPDAQAAELHFHKLTQLRNTALYEVQLKTGRKHQIRLQFSSRQAPLWGDAKYGGENTFASGIALHARSLTFKHPVKDEQLTFVAPLPASWKSFHTPQTQWPVPNPFSSGSSS